MQCDQLRHRIDELLDDRLDLSSDDEVAKHVAACGTCRGLVEAYRAMLLGVDLMADNEPSERFVKQTVARHGRRMRSGRKWALAALAVAAALAVLAVPLRFSWQGNPPPGLSGRQNHLSQKGQSATHSAVVDELYAKAMGRALQMTGRKLAYLPDTVRSVASHPEADRIVGHFRPLTAPVGTAWEVLLRSWTGEPQHAAEIPAVDTSFVRWRAAKYA